MRWLHRIDLGALQRPQRTPAPAIRIAAQDLQALVDLAPADAHPVLRVGHPAPHLALGRMGETWDRVEQIFEDRLTRVLGRLGVPNHDDLRELTQRIDALQAHLDELSRAQANPRS